MTVTYTAQVATCRGFGCFLILLKRWRGSIYKLVWLDLLAFLSLYYALNIIYRLLLNNDQKELFENLVRYCSEYSDLIPLSFVLGFYVSIVMTRWWNQYTSIPFPDSLAVFVSATIHGQDERGRVMRRTIMRYVCLTLAMTFTMISPRVKKRFPTLDHFVEAGLLQHSEKESMEHLNNKFPTHAKQWLPIVWASSIVTRARKEGRIRDDFAVKTILDELNGFRGKCGLLLSYDSISVPLVYTQVVTLAVYSYFITTVMGHQWVDGKQYKVDLYFPVFSTLQFFFYMGWLKVAESLINPFGDDDDDFEVNWMVDRNLQISYLIVDEMHHEHPELVRDQYWDEVFPQELPYTGSEKIRDQMPQPSTANIAVKNVKENETTPSSLRIDDVNSYGDDMHSIINFSAKPPYGRSDSSKILGSSVPDAISRNNSVVRLFKRFLSREDGNESKNESYKNDRNDSKRSSTADLSNSTQNLKPADPKRQLANEPIEEVDEQSTIQSNKMSARPTVLEFFNVPRHSDPVPVPSVPRRSSVPIREPHYRGSTSSAPEKYSSSSKDTVDRISIGSSDSEAWADEFTRLKRLREKERQNRIIQNLARSLSNPAEETEMLLLDNVPATPTTPVGPKEDGL